MEKFKFETPVAPKQNKENQEEAKNEPQITTENTYENKEELDEMEFEYQDKDGKIIGKAVIKLQEEPVSESEYGIKYYKLLDFRITGQENGKNTEIDIISLIDLKNTKICIPSGGVSFRYDVENDIAIIPLPETPIQIATMLHELGHAKQFEEKTYSNIGNLDTQLPGLWGIADVPEKIRKIKSTIDNLDKKTIERLNKLEQLAKKIISEKLEEPSPIVLEYIKLWKENQEHFVDAEPEIQIMERDATKRAIQWMRKIRDRANVNLFKNLGEPAMLEAIEKNYYGNEEEIEFAKLRNKNCENALDYLKAALKSYGADTELMRKQYDGSIIKAKK